MKKGATIITPQGFTEVITNIIEGFDGKHIYTNKSKDNWYHESKITILND